MKKYLKYIVTVVLVLASVFAARAAVGCNLGNSIYPNATGGVNSNGYPTFYNSNPITIRWWEGDPNCGILSNRIQVRSSTEDKCEVLGNNWGVVYNFNNADNSCNLASRPTQVPLDDYVWAIILTIGSVGGYMISKKGIIIG